MVENIAPLFGRGGNILSAEMKGAKRNPKSPTWHNSELIVVSRLKLGTVYFRSSAGNEWSVPDPHE